MQLLVSECNAIKLTSLRQEETIGSRQIEFKLHVIRRKVTRLTYFGFSRDYYNDTNLENKTRV